jgi:PhnB protein
MVQTIPYLLVKSGKKAIALYEECFGAKLISHEPFKEDLGKMMGFPEDFDYKNSTMHARLDILGAPIYLADNAMGAPFDSSGNVEVLLDLESKEQLDLIYEKAKNLGFNIKMELQKTFWGAYFARFEDTEGIGWQINYNEE